MSGNEKEKFVVKVHKVVVIASDLSRLSLILVGNFLITPTLSPNPHFSFSIAFNNKLKFFTATSVSG